MPTRTCAVATFFVGTLLGAGIYMAVTNTHREDRADLWRCVELITEQPPETDVAEAMERCRVMLARKEVRP